MDTAGGSVLLERGLVSGQELERALDLQRRLGGRLGGILVRSGAICSGLLIPDTDLGEKSSP